LGGTGRRQRGAFASRDHMSIRNVGVVGCGLMGSGIAQVCAEAGYRVIVREVTEEQLQKGLGRIDSFLARGVAKGRLTAERKTEVLERLEGTTELGRLDRCELVIEAVVESLDKKRELLQELDAVCPERVLFASNTSSLSITELAAATRRPSRVVGLHFFNPVPLMKLVEVVRSPLTAAEVYEAAVSFVETLSKTPIRTSDRTGFVVNRLLVPYLLDAIRALEEGVGSVADIDDGMRLGCGHPMGPLTLLDFVGLDTTLAIANIMFDDFRERRFAPPPLLRRLVQAGLLGRKSGKGFYDYSLDPPQPVAGLR
jgi:3-hydroxybutyryl-CoA dehydrogenase